jgi:anti-anti-sigma factor
MELKLVRIYPGNPQSDPTQNTDQPQEESGTTNPGQPGISTYAGSEILIIGVEGEVDTNTAGALEASLIEEFEKGARLLILELSQMEYVSSVGLRVLLAHLKKLKTSQGRLVLTGLNEEVQEIFDMAGFSALFEISPDLEAAKQALQA